MEIKTTLNLIQKVVDFAAANCFVDSYIEDTSLAQRQEEGLGMVVSQWAEWDRDRIMSTFVAALEDAGRRRDADAVRALWRRQ